VIGREVPPTAGLPLRWSDFVPSARGESLETGLARFLAVPAVQVECSGTASFLVSLEALKERSGRRTVVIPAYTCPLVPLAVARAGLRIRLCDTAADRFDFDLDALEAACDGDTLCVVPTHLGGAVADLEPVLEIARARGAYVIEDAAQALGATLHGKHVGTIGDVGFYSFARGKGLTLFEGGAWVARDSALREELERTRRKRIPRASMIEARRLVELVGYAASYRPALLGLVYGFPLRYWLRRGDPARAVGDVADSIPLHRVSAARKRIGASALPRLRPWLAAARERGEERARRIGEIEGIDVVVGAEASRGTWPFLMVLFRSASACEMALRDLWTARLGVTRLFVHDLTGYRFLETAVPRADVPKARSFAARCLTVSNSPWLSDTEFERIVEVLTEAAERQRSVLRASTSFSFSARWAARSSPRWAGGSRD
jgi:perosamine synthetase